MSIIFSSSSKSIILLRLISFISFVVSQSPESMPFSCPHSSNNTSSDTFTSNLNLLFNQVPDEAYSSMYLKTSEGKYPDMVYGLYLCRGDRKMELCQSCTDLAIDNLRKDCWGTKEAIIWYDDCMVRYSDKSFSSKVETSPYNCSTNKQTFIEPEKLRKIVTQSLYEVIAVATSKNSSKKYAEHVVNVSGTDKLYSLVQCLPDLSIEDCRACLSSSADSILSCYQDKRGARFLNPSCNIRFELYPFFLAREVPPASPIVSTAPRGRKGSKIWIEAITTVSAFLILVAVLFIFIWNMRRTKTNKEKNAISQELQLLELGGVRIGDDYSDILQGEKQGESQEFPLFPLDLTLKATKHFSDETKLGEGGFGPVYKGILADGKEIAVKRLSRTSGQGIQEFKTEVTVIAKLQHKNLVRLLGCCLGKNELLLIYEYMPNKSLDFLLFDSSRSVQLDWEKRSGIIRGIARGVLYLHEDSRLKIIHRDLKASNILLDHEMNPKISDFGMARIFGGNQNEANTNKVVGTYGYMSPEYAMEGLFSVKSDVFSFGVLLLEIISGEKNSGFYLSEQSRCLLTHAWNLWREGNTLELMDPVLKQSYIPDQVLKCIHIGLLCVQEDPAERPNMSSVVVMLVSDTITLPQPTQPPFSIRRGALKLSQSLADATGVSFASEATVSEVSRR